MRTESYPTGTDPLNQIVARSSKRWKAFPNITTMGSYDFFSQIIRLNSLESRDIQAVQNAPTDINLRKKLLPVAVHEATHWLDHLSTLWGQQSLIGVYNAINARLLGKEGDFWRIVDARMQAKRIGYVDYYSEIYAAGKLSWDRKPWKQGLSLGREFDPGGRVKKDSAIGFVKFYTSDNRPVARVPLCIAALLETTATWAELQVDGGLISELTGDEKLVESKLTEKKYLERLYDADLCVYTSCAHLLANSSRLHDHHVAYERASKLATLCLNLPKVAFGRIKIDQNKFSGFDMKEHLARSYDRALAFYTLCEHAPIGDDYVDDVDKWLDQLVDRSGLGTLEELHREGDEELSNYNEVLEGPESARLEDLLTLGKRLRSRRKACGRFGFLKIQADSLNSSGAPVDCPVYLLGDDELYVLGTPAPEATLHPSKLINWLYKIWDYEAAIEEFLDGCMA